MTTKADHLRALARCCRRFGGQLVILTQAAFDRIFEDRERYATGFLESPFTSAHGLHWERKKIYAVRGREEVGSIIHEMGHVFADPASPNHGSNEWPWLGWEIALAREIGAGRVWSRQNANYHIHEGGGKEWGSLTRGERYAITRDRLAHAKKIKLLDDQGRIQSVR